MANMLYNGVELPDIDSVWTSEIKEERPYAYLASYNDRYFLRLSDTSKPVAANNAMIMMNDGYTYELLDGVWTSGVATISNTVFWSNEDVYYAESAGGSLYLSGSVPVATFTPADFLRWFSLGQAVRRAVGARGEATMYSYNGVVLPKLPEWDKSKYPYAVISCLDDSDEYTLFVSAEAITYRTYYGVLAYIVNMPCLSYKVADGAWSLSYEHSSTALIAESTSHGVWANHDVLNADGQVQLAKLEPIPVYE